MPKVSVFDINGNKVSELDLAESVIWLFSLLWNNQFSPDFIEFRTSKGKFIYKQSDKYQFKYFDVINKSLRTDISDFDVKELSYSIERWFRFVEKEMVSIGSFFETQYNEHIIPSLRYLYIFKVLLL